MFFPLMVPFLKGKPTGKTTILGALPLFLTNTVYPYPHEFSGLTGVPFFSDRPERHGQRGTEPSGHPQMTCTSGGGIGEFGQISRGQMHLGYPEMDQMELQCRLFWVGFTFNQKGSRVDG